MSSTSSFCGRLEFVWPDAEDGVFRGLRIAQLGPHPRQEDVELEWLGHIVAGPESSPRNGALRPPPAAAVSMITGACTPDSLSGASPSRPFAAGQGKVDIQEDQVGGGPTWLRQSPRLRWRHRGVNSGGVRSCLERASRELGMSSMIRIVLRSCAPWRGPAHCFFCHRQAYAVSRDLHRLRRRMDGGRPGA